MSLAVLIVILCLGAALIALVLMAAREGPVATARSPMQRRARRAGQRTGDWALVFWDWLRLGR